jgi:nucleoside-diphosphate-sugar epimerase
VSAEHISMIPRGALLVAGLWWLACCDAALKVTVLGGTGFVGSRVCKILVGAGAEVTSVSKSGAVPDWASAEEWTGKVQWRAVDLLSADEAAIDTAMGSPGSVISCVGVVDPSAQKLLDGNGKANIKGFASARRAGVKRAVYVSVGSEVAACEENWLPFAKDEFSAYFEGKRLAEDAAAAAVGNDATKLCVIKPTFIYGGDGFALPLPGKFVAPRVSSDYGYFVEEILALGPVQALADAAPGLIKVALRPPSSVEAVATACAFAALGELTSGQATRRAVGTLDGTAAIKAAAGEVPASGISEGLDRALNEIGDLTQKLLDAIDARLDGKK